MEIPPDFTHGSCFAPQHDGGPLTRCSCCNAASVCWASVVSCLGGPAFNCCGGTKAEEQTVWISTVCIVWSMDVHAAAISYTCTAI